MKLSINDRVANVKGTPGTVVAVNNDTEPGEGMAKVQFDTGRAGWFDLVDDDRLTLLTEKA